MNDQYLHGVEILEAPAGPRPVRASSVGAVGLVGTALAGPAGPAIVAGRLAGEDSYGSAGTIPAALAAIYDQGIAPWIVVVNALDRSTHRTAVAAADFTFSAAGAVQLGHRLVSDVVVYEFSEAEVAAGSDAAAVEVEGVDYAVDPATGIVSRIEGGGIVAASTKRISYKYVDESLVTEAQVAAAAARLLDTESELGLIPRILIAPGWTGRVTRAAAVAPAIGAIEGATVTAALLGLADRLRGIVVADGPNTTDAEAIAYRELFDSRRLFIVDPGVKLAGSAGATYDAPASGRAAGVMARNDADPERGFWWSPSNRPVLGIAGTSRPVSFTLSDATSGSNQPQRARGGHDHPAAGVPAVGQPHLLLGPQVGVRLRRAHGRRHQRGAAAVPPVGRRQGHNRDLRRRRDRVGQRLPAQPAWAGRHSRGTLLDRP